MQLAAPTTTRHSLLHSVSWLSAHSADFTVLVLRCISAVSEKRNVRFLTERFSRYVRICPVDTFPMSLLLLPSSYQQHTVKPTLTVSHRSRTDVTRKHVTQCSPCSVLTHRSTINMLAPYGIRSYGSDSKRWWFQTFPGDITLCHQSG